MNTPDLNEQPRYHELSTFLRTRRERLQPDEVGLSSGTRRRTPGLRREEVAYLAGIGVDWYTRLEQGREIRVSDQVLDSIAQALKLTKVEREHLYLLAHGNQPLPIQPPNDHIGPSVRLLVEHHGIMPAMVVGYRWDVLLWNQSAAWLYDDFGKLPDKQRNIVHFMFTSPVYRQTLVNWEFHARRLLAEFRSTYGRYVDDPSYLELIQTLHESSPEFEEWWSHHDVLSRGDGNYKEIQHPEAGLLKFHQTILLSAENLNLKIVLIFPDPDSDTMAKLEQFVPNDD